MKKTQSVCPRVFCEADLYAIPKAHPESAKGKAKGKGTSKYRVRLNVGYDRATGEPVWKSFYAPTASEARQRAYQYIQEAIEQHQQQEETDSLLVTAMEDYLFTERFGRKKPSTFDRLEEILRVQIAPYIQGLRTDQVTRADCEAVLDANLEKGYSYSVLDKTCQLLKAFFRFYCDEHPGLRDPMRSYKLYSREYVLEQQRKLRTARDAAREKRSAGKRLTAQEAMLASSPLKMQDTDAVELFTDEEIQCIQQTAETGYVITWVSKKGNPVQTKPKPIKQAELILFLLCTGLRNGELRALQYSDVDFENGTIEITQTRSVSKTRGKDRRVVGGMSYEDGSPKTKSSLRKLPLSDQALDCLRRLKAKEPEGYEGYIANAGGKPLTHGVLFRRYSTLLRHAGVPHRDLHALRRTFATKFYSYTRDQVLVDHYLGHASRSVTEKYYLGNQLEANRELIRGFKI